MQYFHVTALESDGVTQTISLSAVISIGDHWLVSPLARYSNSDELGSVSYESLSVSFNS